MNKKTLSINVDMGMHYNGVYYADMDDMGESLNINNKMAVCISMRKGSLVYSKDSSHASLDKCLNCHKK